MSSTTKRYVIFAFLSLIIIIIGIYSYSPKKPSPTITLPENFNRIEKQLPINPPENQIQLNAPDSTSLIRIIPRKISDNEANQVALNLGFSNQPQNNSSLKEPFYIWNNPASYLYINPNYSSFKFDLNNPLNLIDNEIVDDQTLIVRAEEFLENNLNLKKDFIKFTSFTYLKFSSNLEDIKEVSKNDSNVIQLNFTYKDINHTTYNIMPFIPILYLQMLKNGTIIKAEGIILDKINHDSKQYSLKNYNEIINSLNESILLMIKNKYLSIDDITREDIKTIDIDKIEFIYLLDQPGSKILKPSFFLEGNINIDNYSNIRALLYLPAIKNP